MAIPVKCPHCRTKIKAPDNVAGKKVKCPSCNQAFRVPEVAATAAAGGESKGKGGTAPATSDDWYMQTSDGEEYGPVTKDELDGWVTEGRLDAECQLLREGWEQWKWASDVYPELSDEATHTGSSTGPADNPFAGLDFGESDEGGGGPALEEEFNPFEAPATSPRETEDYGDEDIEPITDGMVRSLRGTRIWALFVGIGGFIVAAIYLLGAFGSLLAGPAAIIATPMYLTMAAMMGGVAFFACSYYGRIGNFLVRQDSYSMEAALESQRKFWLLSGIMVLIGLVLMALAIILVFALGFGAMMFAPRPG